MQPLSDPPEVIPEIKPLLILLPFHHAQCINPVSYTHLDVYKRQPVWSEQEFAELFKWDNYQPNSISLDDFIDKLLPKLEKDNVMLAVFPLSKGKGIIRTVQEIIADIERECEQYE